MIIPIIQFLTFTCSIGAAVGFCNGIMIFYTNDSKKSTEIKAIKNENTMLRKIIMSSITNFLGILRMREIRNENTVFAKIMMAFIVIVHLTIKTAIESPIAVVYYWKKQLKNN